MDTPASYSEKSGFTAGRSPAVKDGNLSIIESSAIAEYIPHTRLDLDVFADGVIKDTCAKPTAPPTVSSPPTPPPAPKSEPGSPPPKAHSSCTALPSSTAAPPSPTQHKDSKTAFPAPCTGTLIDWRKN
jgi:hypothetical protein